ncbi:MAG TPA: alpha amylase C-terminal domain-containing protein, partial [Candidatus Obscuribacterales bacterium]
AFGRGDRGFVVINRETSPLTRTFQTQLPAGRYCDVLHTATVATPECDRVITVNRDGQFTATVSALGAIALHHQARP